MITHQSKEIRETALSSYAGSPTAVLFIEERKWISKILRLKEKYPDEVIIQEYDKDFGSIVVEIPSSWMKMSPKTKQTLSDNQRKERAERLAKLRNSKIT